MRSHKIVIRHIGKKQLAQVPLAKHDDMVKAFPIVGQVIAETEDYQVVRELVADLLAIGVEATIKPEVREVVQAVGALLKKGRQEVRPAKLKSAALKKDHRPAGPGQFGGGESSLDSSRETGR